MNKEREFFIFHFCMNSECVNYFEDNCLISNIDNKDEFKPKDTDYDGECPKFVEGKHEGYSCGELFEETQENYEV